MPSSRPPSPTPSALVACRLTRAGTGPGLMPSKAAAAEAGSEPNAPDEAATMGDGRPLDACWHKPIGRARLLEGVAELLGG